MSLTNVYTVRLETIPPRRVAFIRHTGPYRKVEGAFKRLFAWAGRHRLMRGDTVVLGLCWDDPEVCPEDKLRFDCCITVPEEVEGEGEIGTQTIAGGEYALVTHCGPYTGLDEAYRYLYGAWLPQSGRQPSAAPPIEVYDRSTCQTPPEEIRTVICVPLQPREQGDERTRVALDECQVTTAARWGVTRQG
jgi:AraC family transcriptional regulator